MDREEYLRYEPFLARRCWAATLDYLFYFGMFYIYVRFVGAENEQGIYEAKGFSHFIAIVLIWFIYFPVMEGIVGYTVFKGVFDLKVVQERRQDYRFMVAFKRHLLDPIDFFFFGIVAIILVKTRSDHKRLGDIVAHSKVVLDKNNEHVSLSVQSDTANGV